MRCLLVPLLASVAVASPLFRRQAPLTPAQDPFYTPDAGSEASRPGTVLRSRTIVPSFGDEYDVTAWQLLYVSTQSNGTKMATVTTIFKPKNATLDSLIAYSTAYDSDASQCEPSYTYQKGSAGNTIIRLETPLISSAFAKGLIVVSSDYEGPNAAFAAGRQSGQAVLDGVRAAIKFRSTLGLSTRRPKVALAGYSGGAIASGWASALASSYARELKIVGAAFGGTPADVAGTLRFLDGGQFAGFGFAGATGLISSYPEMAKVFDEVATQAGKDAIAKALTQCGTDDLYTFFNERLLSDKYSSLGANLLEDPRVRSITDTLILGAVPSETPHFPILMWHGSQDTTIPITDARKAAQDWCDHGVPSLNFVTYTTPPSDHITTGENGAAAALAFIVSRLAGEAVAGGCCFNETV